jgi:hypothetical protein
MILQSHFHFFEDDVPSITIDADAPFILLLGVYIIFLIQPRIIVFTDKMFEWFVHWHIKWLYLTCHATRNNY